MEAKRKREEEEARKQAERELEGESCLVERQFKHRTFYVLNVISSVKDMKRLTFESIKSDTSNLGQPMSEVRVAHMWSNIVSELRSDFSYAQPNA